MLYIGAVCTYYMGNVYPWRYRVILFLFVFVCMFLHMYVSCIPLYSIDTHGTTYNVNITTVNNRISKLIRGNMLVYTGKF